VSLLARVETNKNKCARSKDVRWTTNKYRSFKLRYVHELKGTSEGGGCIVYVTNGCCLDRTVDSIYDSDEIIIVLWIGTFDGE